MNQIGMMASELAKARQKRQVNNQLTGGKKEFIPRSMCFCVGVGAHMSFSDYNLFETESVALSNLLKELDDF